MTENTPDRTTKSAETLSGVARFAAYLGIIAFIIGLVMLIAEGGDAGILTACLYGGGFAAFIGLLMLTLQSCTMLIIRELWEIERSRKGR